SAIKQFRALGLEDKAADQSHAHFGRMSRVQLQLNMVSAAPRLLIEVLFLLGLAAAVVVLVPRMADPTVLSGLGLTVMATVRLLPSFATSASTWVQVHQALPAIIHIGDELERLEREAESQRRGSGRTVLLQNSIVASD